MTLSIFLCKWNRLIPEIEVRSYLALLYLDKNMSHAAQEEIEGVIQYLEKNRSRIDKIGYVRNISIQLLFNINRPQ